jgi:hypothetical protein
VRLPDPGQPLGQLRAVVTHDVMDAAAVIRPALGGPEPQAERVGRGSPSPGARPAGGQAALRATPGRSQRAPGPAIDGQLRVVAADCAREQLPHQPGLSAPGDRYERYAAGHPQAAAHRDHRRDTSRDAGAGVCGCCPVSSGWRPATRSGWSECLIWASSWVGLPGLEPGTSSLSEND